MLSPSRQFLSSVSTKRCRGGTLPSDSSALCRVSEAPDLLTFPDRWEDRGLQGGDTRGRQGLAWDLCRAPPCGVGGTWLAGCRGKVILWHQMKAEVPKRQALEEPLRISWSIAFIQRKGKQAQLEEATVLFVI